MKNKVVLSPLSHIDYLVLKENARVIEGDEFGDKVLLLPDETYVKLFRRKRFLSSAAWRPYACRFAENIAVLNRLGIPCPRVIGTFRVASIERDAVHYEPLEGKTVRQLVEEGMSSEKAGQLRIALRVFIEHLHDLGVYFRSIHLGNIVLTPAGALGLIDVADLMVRRRLGRFRRRRNMRHMLRYKVDRSWLEESPEWQCLIQDVMDD